MIKESNFNLKKNKYVDYISFGLGLSVVYFSMSALNVALPFIQAEFQVSSSALTWIINAYIVTTAVNTLAAGSLGDLFGRKKVYLIGIILFILSSILCALSTFAFFLIITRVFQGFGAAMILTMADTITSDIVSEKNRSGVASFFGLVAISLTVIGPIIGGVFIQFATWRWIFWMNALFGTFSFFAVYFLLKDIKYENNSKVSFDYLGQGLFLGILAPFIIALMQVNVWGWTSKTTLCFFSISAFLIPIFIWVEQKKNNPLFNLKLFKNINFIVGSIIFFCRQFTVVANVLYILYLQKSLNFDPTFIGLALIPANFFSFVSNPFSGYTIKKLGYKLVIQLSLGVLSISFLSLIFTASTLKYVYVLIPLLLISIASPSSIISCYVLVMSSISSNEKGAISGISIMLRQSGGAVCIALMGLIVTQVEQKYFNLCMPKLYAKAFSHSMLMITIVIVVAFFATFWIDKKKHLTVN